MQCPVCGREVEDLVGALCAQCASERKPFLDVPDVVDVVRCAHCGRVQRRATWQPAPDERDAMVASALDEAVDVDPGLVDPNLDTSTRWEDERNAVASVRLTGSFHGFAVDRAGEARVRLKSSACPDCSRRFGGYFEAILQVRGSEGRALRTEEGRILARVDTALESYRASQRGGAFVSRSEHVRGGVDLYLGSLEVARLVAHDLAQRYGAEYGESGKLVGRKDGRDLYRFTLLVRLPPYVPGDFLLLDGRLFKVLRHERKRLTLWDLERRERVHREPRLARQLKVVGHAEDEKDAVVVSARRGDLQVLDPVTLKTLDLHVEPDWAARESVRVFRHEDRVWVLPDGLDAS